MQEYWRTLFTHTSSSLPCYSPAGLRQVYGSWVEVGVEVGHGEVLKSWAKKLLLYSHWGIWNFNSFLKQIFLTLLAWLKVQAVRSCSCCILRTTYVTHPKGDNEGCGRRLVYHTTGSVPTMASIIRLTQRVVKFLEILNWKFQGIFWKYQEFMDTLRIEKKSCLLMAPLNFFFSFSFSGGFKLLLPI